MGSLPHWEQAFASVGWFIPPFVAMGRLSEIAGKITARPGSFQQSDLELALAQIYDPIIMAAMVLHRYPIVPVIQDYRVTIGEAVKAHFLRLDHLAVAGLVPVIEGAGRKLAAQRGLKQEGVTKTFQALAEDCKREVIAKNMGATGEIESMLDSFAHFVSRSLYVQSSDYAFDDGTNRHGILHGAFADGDYGSQLNFYKVMGAVDFLTFVSSFRASVSWLTASPTEQSIALSFYYRQLEALATIRKA